MINAIKYSIPRKRGKNPKLIFLKGYVKLFYSNVKINKELVKKNGKCIIFSNCFSQARFTQTSHPPNFLSCNSTLSILQRNPVTKHRMPANRPCRTLSHL